MDGKLKYLIAIKYTNRKVRNGKGDIINDQEFWLDRGMIKPIQMNASPCTNRAEFDDQTEAISHMEALSRARVLDANMTNLNGHLLSKLILLGHYHTPPDTEFHVRFSQGTVLRLYQAMIDERNIVRIKEYLDTECSLEWIPSMIREF